MIMDVMEIQEIIPHRYPFLLLDRVTDIVKNETLVGYKNVTIGDNGITEDDILVHDAKENDITLHMMLATMRAPKFPVAMGVIRAVKELTYDDGMMEQLEENIKTTKFKNSDDLFNSGDTWEV